MQTNFTPAPRMGQNPNSNATVVLPANGKKKTNLAWQTVGLGAGTGVMLGIGGALLLNGITSDAATPAEAALDALQDTPVTPPAPAPAPAPAAHHHQTPPPAPAAEETLNVELPDEIQIAQSVTDDMSYADAFEAARAEVGPGGLFAWNGNIYTTYTDDELQHMTPAQLEQYTEGVQNTLIENGVMGPEIVGPTDNGGDIDVEHFQAIDVQYDEEMGCVVAVGTTDGHATIMADVDGDGRYDIAGIDANDDGQISENEIMEVTSGKVGYNAATVNMPGSEGTPVDVVDGPTGDEGEDVVIAPETPEVDYLSETQTPAADEAGSPEEYVAEVTAEPADSRHAPAASNFIESTDYPAAAPEMASNSLEDTGAGNAEIVAEVDPDGMPDDAIVAEVAEPIDEPAIVEPYTAEPEVAVVDDLPSTDTYIDAVPEVETFDACSDLADNSLDSTVDDMDVDTLA